MWVEGGYDDEPGYVLVHDTIYETPEEAVAALDAYGTADVEGAGIIPLEDFIKG